MAEILDFSNMRGAASSASAAGAGAAKDARGARGAGAVSYEHPVPKTGDAAQLSYPARRGDVAVELTVTPDAHATFRITVPAEQVRATIQDAREALARTVGVDPRDLRMMSQLKETLGQAAFDDFVASFAQRRFFSKAVERTGVEPYISPRYAADAKPAEDADYTFTADALMAPKVSLTSYDPVEVAFPEKRSISSKDVTAYLDRIADQLATYEPDLTKHVAAAGDRVMLRVRGSVDGKPMDALTSDQQPYEVGSGALTDEVDKALVGMEVGATATVSASLPVSIAEDGTPQFAMAQITVRLLEIDRKVPARIDDGWVMQNAPSAGTLLGLRSQIRTALEKDADAEWHAQLEELTARELTKRLVWDIPQEYVDRTRDELIEQLTVDLQRQGLGIESYLRQSGLDEATLKEEIGTQAVENLRRAAALDAIADHLGITVTDAEAVQTVGEEASGRESEVVRAVKETGQMTQLRAFARRMRANEWLANHAKDASGPHLQLV